jgi:hypothetical protein
MAGALGDRMRMGRLLLAGAVAVALLGGSPDLGAIEPDQFDELVGFTVLAATEISGVADGDDESSVVQLANGMRYDLGEDANACRYEPTAVFALTLDPAQMKRLKPQSKAKVPVTLYKLLIEDQLYDAYRIR